ALGAGHETIIQFLNHPWYSPRQETIITAALKKIQLNPDLFLGSANKALTDEDGRFFQHVAELLAAYTVKVGPLQSFVIQEELLCAVDRDGVLVVPVSFDYAIWTETVAQRVNALSGLPSRSQNIHSVEIWTNGKASDQARSELQKHSIGYKSLATTSGS
ncbi:MAG: hypothetical protein JO076_12775, partial [Verrucomicrobia bacterium]|nr:hypothetical protein [Verrucomicrobiota bacterium]